MTAGGIGVRPSAALQTGKSCPDNLSWLSVQIEIDAARIAAVETALLAIGAVSIELSNAGDEAIFEPAPGDTPLWRHIRLSALFEPSVDKLTIQRVLAHATAPDSLPPISFGRVENEDWVARLRAELQPLRFGRDLWICPPGKPCPDPNGTVITMEPGLAFGTGTHQTTALCLDWLANRSVENRNILDYGCGSGILGIACLALGAQRVTAVDIDPQAVRATRANAGRNPGNERLIVMHPDELGRGQQFDMLLANILSGTLIDLAPALRDRCRAGTSVTLSGILTQQAGSVAAAFCAWVDFDQPIQRDDWVLLTGIVT